MHILYVHQHFSTPRGAVGSRSYEMARALVRQGHSVTMVCGSYANSVTGISSSFERGCRKGRVDGIDVIEFNIPYSNNDGFMKRTLSFLNYVRKTIVIALGLDYDIIFATSTPLTVGLCGVAAKVFRGKEFVFEVRDLWPELPRAMGVIRSPFILWVMGVLEWASYRAADRLVGLAPGIVEGICRRGVAPDRVALIPNGCDLELFAMDAPSGTLPDIDPDALVAVYAGTFGVANGLHHILAAAAELKRRNRSDVIIWLIGSGGKEAELQRIAAEKGLDNVKFFQPIAKEELKNIFASTHVGIQCLENVPEFYYGTSPNKFFDYISAGLPVLTNYPGWVADLVTGNKCGYAVAPDTPEAVADALENASRDRHALATLGANARALAVRQFDRKVLAEKWCAWVTKGELRYDGKTTSRAERVRHPS